MRPSDPTPAHRRTRADHATETAEDYVEAVDDIVNAAGECRVKDLAERFAVSHVTVTRIVARLAREGLLQTEPHRPIELTDAGTQLANHARIRHDIVFRFLKALGVPDRIAAIDSEGIEHHVSPETLLRFQQFIDSPPPTITNHPPEPPASPNNNPPTGPNHPSPPNAP